LTLRFAFREFACGTMGLCWFWIVEGVYLLEIGLWRLAALMWGFRTVAVYCPTSALPPDLSSDGCGCGVGHLFCVVRSRATASDSSAVTLRFQGWQRISRLRAWRLASRQFFQVVSTAFLPAWPPLVWRFRGAFLVLGRLRSRVPVCRGRPCILGWVLGRA